VKLAASLSVLLFRKAGSCGAEPLRRWRRQHFQRRSSQAHLGDRRGKECDTTERHAE